MWWQGETGLIWLSSFCEHGKEEILFLAEPLVASQDTYFPLEISCSLVIYFSSTDHVFFLVVTKGRVVQFLQTFRRNVSYAPSGCNLVHVDRVTLRL